MVNDMTEGTNKTSFIEIKKGIKKWQRRKIFLVTKVLKS